MGGTRGRRYRFQRGMVLRDQPQLWACPVKDKGITGPQLRAFTTVEFEGVEPGTKGLVAVAADGRRADLCDDRFVLEEIVKITLDLSTADHGPVRTGRQQDCAGLVFVDDQVRIVVFPRSLQRVGPISQQYIHDMIDVTRASGRFRPSRRRPSQNGKEYYGGGCVSTQRDPIDAFHGVVPSLRRSCDPHVDRK